MFSQTLSRFMVLLVGLALPVMMCPGISLADEAESIDPVKSNALLLKAQSGRAIWLTSQIHPETVSYRAPTYSHRFYVQSLGEQDAFLRHEIGDVGTSFLVCVRPDGTLLVENRRSIDIVPISGSPTAVHLNTLFGSLSCLAIYSDGILVEDWSEQVAKQCYPVYFVPFDGNIFHAAQRIKVAEAGVRSWTCEQGVRYPSQPNRFANTFLWTTGTSIHAFDLKSGERKSVTLDPPVHPSYNVTAFDGDTVVLYDYAYDATSGKLLGETDHTKRRHPPPFVFAVRNRIGYYYEYYDGQHHLMASNLSSKEGANLILGRAAAIPPNMNEEGLSAWDGRQWTVIPWLKK